MGREDDESEALEDVEHINELIKRRCTSTRSKRESC